MDIKSSDWSPDIILRRREHPATIFQAPLPSKLDQTSCLYAVQLKSWYDEQYNDWAKRYVSEHLYNPDGVDRGADYMYAKVLPPPKPKKRIVPTKVIDDDNFVITECK